MLKRRSKSRARVELEIAFPSKRESCFPFFRVLRFCLRFRSHFGVVLGVVLGVFFGFLFGSLLVQMLSLVCVFCMLAFWMLGGALSESCAFPQLLFARFGALLVCRSGVCGVTLSAFLVRSPIPGIYIYIERERERETEI